MGRDGKSDEGRVSRNDDLVDGGKTAIGKLIDLKPRTSLESIEDYQLVGDGCIDPNSSEIVRLSTLIEDPISEEDHLSSDKLVS